MWVESRNGKYIFRERYLAVDGAARTVSISLSSNSKIAAKKAHTLLQAKIAEKQDNRPGRTLESVLDDYIVGRKLAVKPLTLRNYDLFRRRILAAFPGDRDVTTITARDWQRAFDALALHVSPNAARYTWRFAKAALERAERLDGVSALPLRRVKVDVPQKTVAMVASAADKFLTRTELSEVLSLVAEISPYIALMLEFQALTGMRYGEMVALREQDVDLDTGVAHVTGSLAFNVPGRRYVRGTPKNVYSIRDVRLDARALGIVRKFRARNKLARAWASRAGDKLPDHYIFTSEQDGYPVDISYTNKILRSLGYGKRLTTHVFRHTHISLLAEEGVPLKAIMSRVGHIDPHTTMAVYTHVSARMEQEVQDALDRITI